MHPSSWTWPRCAWSSGPALQASSQVVTPSVVPMIPSVAIQVSPPPISVESAENGTASLFGVNSLGHSPRTSTLHAIS